MSGQDGFLPICLSHDVETLQEQGETWAVVEGQGRLAAHGGTGEEQGVLNTYNPDGANKARGFLGPWGDTFCRSGNYHRPLALKSGLDGRLCSLKTGVI